MTTDGMSALAVALRELHERARRPSTREISARVSASASGGRVSHVAVHSMLSGNNVPRWDNLQAVVIALGGNPDEFRLLWLDASAPVTRITPSEERRKVWLSDREYMFPDEVTPGPGTELTPPADADLAGGRGREFRVAANLLQDGRYCVAELAESGLEVRLSGLERWQAYAIVAILHPPFEE